MSRKITINNFSFTIFIKDQLGIRCLPTLYRNLWITIHFEQYSDQIKNDIFLIKEI